MAEQKHNDKNNKHQEHANKASLTAKSAFKEQCANPCRTWFDLVLVDNEIYLFPDFMTRSATFLHNFCNNAYVALDKFNRTCYRYDRAKDAFVEVAQLDGSIMTMYKAVSYNPLSHKVWIVGGTHDVFCSFSVPDAHTDAAWDVSLNFRGAISDSTTGPLPAAIHVVRDQRCLLHMVGGHNSSYHEVFDVAQRRMRPVFKFKSRLKGQALVYCARLDALIMLGGSQWDERDFRHTIRFRYTALIYVCRRPNDALRSTAPKVQWTKAEDWRLPYNMMGFGHLLVDDRWLLIFGGRINGGDLIDEIWMLDLVESRWSKSTLALPAKGKYRATLLRVDEGARREVRLFMYDHGASDDNRQHFVVDLELLLSSMQAVAAEAMPGSCLASEWTKVSEHNAQLWQQQRAKFLADKVSLGETMAKAEKAINADTALSNRQKAKLIRKLRQKRYKYEHTDFAAPANASLLLPPSLVECKEDEDEKARQVRAQYEANVKAMQLEYEKKLAAVKDELERLKEEHETLRAKVTEADTKKLLNGLVMGGAGKSKGKNKVNNGKAVLNNVSE